MATKMPTMAIVIINSIKVKPRASGVTWQAMELPAGGRHSTVSGWGVEQSVGDTSTPGEPDESTVLSPERTRKPLCI